MYILRKLKLSEDLQSLALHILTRASGCEVCSRFLASCGLQQDVRTFKSHAERGHCLTGRTKQSFLMTQLQCCMNFRGMQILQ